jgi:MoaA/NifB/PqqE/SkfB family radical SAM enzyme
MKSNPLSISAVRKAWNRRFNRLEWKLARPVLHTLPPIVYVEPTNLCQLKCALCPSGQRQIKPVGRMNMDTFRKAVDALGPTARELHLYNWGEPFLHPDLPEMIAYAKRFGPRVVVSTNLQKLDENMAQAVIDAQLDFVNASIDGVSQSVYESYRVGGNVAQVIENLRMLCRLKQAAKSDLPRIDWQFLVTAQNEAELPQAEQLAAELGVRFHPKKVRMGLSEFDTKSAAEIASKDDNWIPHDAAFNRYQNKKRAKHRACKSLWESVVVSWQGWVAPCCQVYKGSHHFAQGFPDNFRAVWNGPEYVAARKLFSEGGSPDAMEMDLVCVRCQAAGNIL